MAIVGHLVILLAIISAVPGDGHNKDSYRVTGFKKFNIEAQNQSKVGSVTAFSRIFTYPCR